MSVFMLTYLLAERCMCPHRLARISCGLTEERGCWLLRFYRVFRVLLVWWQWYPLEGDNLSSLIFHSCQSVDNTVYFQPFVSLPGGKLCFCPKLLLFP